MSRCRVCSAAPVTEGETGHTATLIIRVWREDEPVARLLGAHGTGNQQVSVSAARGIDEICAAVRRWLVASTTRFGDPNTGSG